MPWSAEKLSEIDFLEVQRGQSGLFCSLKHIDFSDLMRSLLSQVGSWCSLWGPLGGPGALSEGFSGAMGAPGVVSCRPRGGL